MVSSRRTTKLVLIWFVAYITYYTDYAFRYEPEITQWTAVLLGSMIGMFAVVVGLYKRMREKDHDK